MPVRFRLGSAHQIPFADHAHDTPVCVDDGHSADPVIEQGPGNLFDGRVGRDGHDIRRHDIPSVHVDSFALSGNTLPINTVWSAEAPVRLTHARRECMTMFPPPRVCLNK
jgi:hypothetical protein